MYSSSDCCHLVHPLRGHTFHVETSAMRLTSHRDTEGTLGRPHGTSSLPSIYTFMEDDRTSPDTCHRTSYMHDICSCLCCHVDGIHYAAHAMMFCHYSVTRRWAQAVLADAADGETVSVLPSGAVPSAPAAPTARIVITSTRSLSVSIRARRLSLFFLLVAFFNSFITLIRSAFKRACSNFIRAMLSVRLIRLAATGAAAAGAAMPAWAGAAALAVGSAAPTAASPCSAAAMVGAAMTPSDMAVMLTLN